MTTRVAVIGLALIACMACDHPDQVSGPDPRPPTTPGLTAPIHATTRPLRLIELPSSMQWDMSAVPRERYASDVAGYETLAPEYQLPPDVSSWFVAAGWGGTATLEGYAFMTFYGNWAQQDLDLRIYRAGALLAQNAWSETGSSFLPRQSGALTSGSLNVGVACGASGNANSRHAAEVRILTPHAWTTLARANVSDSDVAIQADCPPPPTCNLKPQTAISSSARFRAAPSGAVTGSDLEQCANPVPPGGGSNDEPGGYVCYEVWLVYPGTGIEIYLGDVCYGDYAT